MPLDERGKKGKSSSQYHIIIPDVVGFVKMENQSCVKKSEIAGANPDVFRICIGNRAFFYAIFRHKRRQQI
jgi:hypothetical protein